MSKFKQWLKTLATRWLGIREEDQTATRQLREDVERQHARILELSKYVDQWKLAALKAQAKVERLEVRVAVTPEVTVSSDIEFQRLVKERDGLKLHLCNVLEENARLVEAKREVAERNGFLEQENFRKQESIGALTDENLNRKASFRLLEKALRKFEAEVVTPVPVVAESQASHMNILRLVRQMNTWRQRQMMRR